MHPVLRRCSSVDSNGEDAVRSRRARAAGRRGSTYSRYSPSSRLAGRAPRPSRCDAALPSRTPCERLRPSPSPHGVLAARRRLPRRGTARSGAEAGHAGARRHRARQHVLGGHLPRLRAEEGRQADPRLRGLRGAGRSPHQERHAGRDRQPPRAPGGDQRGVPQPDQAGVVGLHRGLLLQAAHRQGSAGPAQQGPDRAVQLSQGRSRRGHLQGSAREGADGRGHLPRHPRPGQLLPRAAVPGARRAEGRQPRPARHRPRSRPADGVHQRRALPARGRLQAARHPALHRHRQVGQRHRSAALSRRSVLPEDAGGDGEDLRRVPGRAGQHGAHRRSRRRQHRLGRELPARLRRPGRLHRRHLLRAHGARRLRRPAAAAAGVDGPQRPALHARRVRAAHGLRNRHDQADEVRRVLPDRVGFHPLRPRARHPGRSGPRLGGRLGGGVVHEDHRRRSDRVRPDLRALPQPRARLAAGYRHRLLRAPPRRGDRLRHPQVRPRERRPDHHLRDDEGEGRGPRRRPRPRHAVRRRRQGRQADPAGARHDAGQGARGEPRPQGAVHPRSQGQGAARHRPSSRGDDAARLGSRRRRRHRAPADHRVRAALQGQAGRNHDPVGDEGDRAGRSPEDGLPRVVHAHPARRRPGRAEAHRRPDHRARRAAAERRGRAGRRGQGARPQGVSAVQRRPHRRGLPVRVVGDARDAAQGQAAALRRPDRPERALPARAAAGRGRRRLHRPQARARRHQVRGQEARAGPARHLRGDRLPGAGHAHRARPGRLLDGRGGSAAQGHGQEGPQGHGQDARALRERLGGARAAGEEGHQDLRLDGVLRRLRLQQVALDDLCAAGLPDRLPQGQPSASLHGRAADHRVAEHRQAGLLPGRVPRHGRHRPGAGHQRQRPAVHRGDGGRPQGRARRPLRPGRDQERRRRRDPVDAGLAQGERRHPRARGVLRARRPAPGQQARGREPGQGRRAGLAQRLRRRPGRRSRRRRGGRGSTPPSTAPSIRAAAARSIASKGSRVCSAATPAATRTSCRRWPRRRRGRKRRCCAARRKRSAST